MNKKNQWVSQRKDGKWALKREGSTKATQLFNTQAQAQQRGVEIAKNNHEGDVIVKGRNGKIRSKDSYGNDPCPPKDTEH
jgi:hypothetical protein